MEQAIAATWSDDERIMILAEILTELEMAEPAQVSKKHTMVKLLGIIRSNKKRAAQGDALAAALKSFGWIAG